MSMPSVAPLDASKLTVELTKQPKELPPTSSLVFGQTFSDHSAFPDSLHQCR